jgi:DNA-binding transcriptional ArsR family regulator
MQFLHHHPIQPPERPRRPITPKRGGLTHTWGALIPFWGGELVNSVLEALFGNRPAACVLLFLQCYGEGHAQRIAKTFGFGLNMTQRQLKRLEEQGVLVSRRLGNMRLFSFNERNPTVRNLRKLLEVELAALPEEEQQQYFRQRQRPRQSNKPLVMHG